MDASWWHVRRYFNACATLIDGKLPNQLGNKRYKKRCGRIHLFTVLKAVTETPFGQYSPEYLPTVINIIDDAVDLVDDVDIIKTLRERYKPDRG